MSDTQPPRQRPLSPHLQIYRPQITSVLSILHRVTGMALSFGVFFTVAFLYWILHKSPACASCFSMFFSNLAVQYVMLLWVFALFYHFFNGIRHLFWDMGWGFEMKTVNQSGIAVVIFSIVSTLFFWMVIL